MIYKATDSQRLKQKVKTSVRVIKTTTQ